MNSTDHWETVSIRYPSGQMNLNLPEIFELPQAKLKKIFRLLLEWDWENRETMRRISAVIPDYVLACEEAWRTASVDFARDFRILDGLPKDLRKSAKYLNDSLFREVKKTKKQYEHAKKVQSIWADMTNTKG